LGKGGTREGTRDKEETVLSYAGMGREELTEILINAGNRPDNIQDYPSWLTAWKAAGGRDPKGLHSANHTSEPKKWDDLIKKYDLPIGLDLSGHQKFTRAGYFCNCKGCGVSGSLWHGDGATPNSLCDTHYKQLQTSWKAETREWT